MQCRVCDAEVGDGARFCPGCGTPTSEPTPAPNPPTGETVGTAELVGQLQQRWRRAQTSPVRVGIVAAIGAFVVLVVVAGVLALGVVTILQDQVQSGEDEAFVSGLFGALVVFVTKYVVYAFNWLPVHIDLFGGLGGIGAREEVTFHTAIVTGLPAVAFVLHRAGRWAARHTTPTPTTENTAVAQGAVIGGTYAALLVLFATLAAGDLELRVAIFEGRASLGPNRLFALLVAGALGSLFASWGALAASGVRPWEVLTRHARSRLDWLVGFVAAGAAWAIGQLVACVVGGAWLVQQLVTEPNMRIGESSEGLSRIAVVVGAVVYGMNFTTVLLLRGMGVPLRQVDGERSESLELSALLQLGATAVAVAVLVLAGYLAQAAVRRRFDTVRVVTRTAVCFALLAVLLSRVALLRSEAGGETFGTTASIPWVFLIALLEAAVLGMVGSQLALRGSLPIERVRGLRWFTGPVLGHVDPLDTEPDAQPEAVPPRHWNRKLTAALAALVVIPLAAVTVVPALVGRQSPAEAVRRYLDHVDGGDGAAVAADIAVPDGAGELVSAEAATAMVRENPRRIENVQIGETRTSGGTTVVEATFEEDGRAVRRTFEVAKAKGRRHFGFWGVWVVVPTTTRISIDVPVGGGALTVDGLRMPAARPGDTVTVEVLDGLHRVRMAASGLLEAVDRRVDTTRERRLVLQPRLSDKGKGVVKDAVLAYFGECAKTTSIRPTGCPQSVFPRGSEQQNVSWSLQGDPTADLETELRSDGVVLATGSFTMTVTYDWTYPGFFGPPETGHESTDDAGTYYLRFAIDGNRVKLVGADSF